jgi:UDP-N-acetylmuramoyl-tripeptide--D-alanyl-D-alanine ligase
MFKNLIKKIFIFKLNLIAKLYIWRFKPVIVAVTGNVGKTSTKEAIATVLGRVKKIRSGKGNLNNEFGVPLTIIGDWMWMDDYYEGGNTFWFWFKVLFTSFFKWFFIRHYPEILVLEYGADKPGDIESLVKKFKPHIGVVTAVGEIPSHVEFFSGPEEVAKEKSKLVSSLGSSDFAVLNFDDLAVLDMKNKTKAKVITYGFGQGADLRISAFDFKTDGEKPLGVVFKLHYGNSFVPVHIYGSLGRSQAYAAAAAAAIGLIMGLNLVKISEAISYYKGPNGRLKILAGIKNSWIIDDTYNSSPSATSLALSVLRELPAKRRIVVLGDMLELGKYTIQAHQTVGNLIDGFFDILVCVGLRAKFIADSAANQMPKENIYTFETSDLAKKKVQDLIKEGDLILIKGSQGMRMEKIVEEIMAEPEKKKDLLVRQNKKWLKK